jgi:Pyruvate/2-oxoacid:ferredoxin oxidoreductase delta subunit
MDRYELLAEHLNRQPGSFPRTESGVELRILRKLFSEEDADLALHLTLIPENARVIARRANIPVEEAQEHLESMARRGLIFSTHPEGRPAEYMATQFAVGFYEFQVDTMDEELARDASEFLHSFPPEEWQKAPQIRTIPVGESIPTQLEVINYEQAGVLLEAQDKFRVNPCICRKKESMVGKGCDKPLETCLVMGSAAEYYERNGIGRAIDKEGAFDILRQADEAGLVLQPANTQEAGFICCCCGDCCGVLQIAKRHPRPAEVLVSTFFAKVDEELCSACADCETRCQMEAIASVNGYAEVDLNRCIGCGLCVTTCPEEAVTLVRKSQEEQPLVPVNDQDLYISMLRARGLVNTPGLVKMVVRSKMDRLLSSL